MGWSKKRSRRRIRSAAAWFMTLTVAANMLMGNLLIASAEGVPEVKEVKTDASQFYPGNDYEFTCTGTALTNDILSWKLSDAISGVSIEKTENQKAILHIGLDAIAGNKFTVSAAAGDSEAHSDEFTIGGMGELTVEDITAKTTENTDIDIQMVEGAYWINANTVNIKLNKQKEDKYDQYKNNAGKWETIPAEGIAVSGQKQSVQLRNSQTTQISNPIVLNCDGEKPEITDIAETFEPEAGYPAGAPTSYISQKYVIEATDNSGVGIDKVYYYDASLTDDADIEAGKVEMQGNEITFTSGNKGNMSQVAFFAVDKLGNKSDPSKSYTIHELDAAGPEITVTDAEGKPWDDSQKYYVKKEKSNSKYEVKAEDKDTGVASLTCNGTNLAEPPIDKQNTLSGVVEVKPTDEMQSEELEYALVATDNVGNQSNKILQVTYDPVPPLVKDWTLPETIKDNNNWVNKDIYEDTTNPLLITVNVSDDKSGIEKVEYQINREKEGKEGNTEVTIQDWKEIAPDTNPGEYSVDLAQNIRENNLNIDGTYIYNFKVTDKAGNETTTEVNNKVDNNENKSAVINVDTTAPNINENEKIDYENATPIGEGDEAVYYFNKENKSAIVKIPLASDSSGINSITCSRADKQGDELTGTLEDNGKYAKFTIPWVEDGANQEYNLAIIDKAGNNGEGNFTVNWDTVSPNNIRVYVSDTEDNNTDDNIIWKIGEAIKEFITGEKSIWIDVYAEDAGTGVAEIVCKYKEGKSNKEIELSSKEQGIIQDKKENTVYHYQTKVNIDKEIDAEILSVEAADKAGNITKETSPSTDGIKPRFIVDNTAPTLDVTVNNPANTVDGVAYYSEKELDDKGVLHMTFTLDEEHFLKNGVKQYKKNEDSNHFGESSETILIYKCNYDKAAPEDSDIIYNSVEWDRVNDSEYTATFEFEPGFKYVIQYSMKDGANNNLISEENLSAGTINEGQYSYTFSIDNIAPKGSLEMKSPYKTINDEKLYYNEDSCELTATIEENMFFAQDVKFEEKYAEPGKGLSDHYKDIGLSDEWDKEEGTYKYQTNYTFLKEGNYQFALDYTDRAGHEMNRQYIKDKKETIIVVDRTAPKVEISFDKTGKVSGKDEERITYFANNTTLKVKVTDYNFNPEGVDVSVKAGNPKYGFEQNFNNKTTAEAIKKHFKDASKWETDKKNKAVHYCTYTFEEELEYTVKVSATDWAANNSEDKTEVFVVDKTAPEVSIMPIGQVKQGEYADRSYYKDTVQVKIQVKEHNFFSDNFGDICIGDKDFLVSQDVNGAKINPGFKLNDLLRQKDKKDEDGKEIEWTQEIDKEGNPKDIYEIGITFGVESNYTIKDLQVVDMAGKDSNIADKVEFTVDKTLPKVEYKDFEEVRSLLNYLTFGYFGKNKIIAEVETTDKISGIYGFAFEKTDLTKKNSQPEIFETKTEKPVDTAHFTLDIDPSFKGTLNATAWDYSNNERSNSDFVKHGIIIEDETMHGNTSAIQLEAPKPNTNGFYNSDVDVKVSMHDSYSGIYKTTYGAKTPEINDPKDVSFYPASELEKKGIKTDEHTDIIHLNADRYYSNDITVYAGFEDNAGHNSNKELRNLKIDNKRPIVTVTYDNNNPLNGKYYNRTRTATVTIDERNFDPGRTQLIWTSTGGAPSISEWQRQGENNIAYVTFSADADYTFTVKTTDLADNEAVYNQVDEFTVDQTQPVIQVSYDNNNAREGNYYNAARTATIQITEHNFNGGEVQVTGTATENGAGVSFPATNGWSSSGDVHTATINYSEDAHYTFSIAYTDMAGNAAAPYQEEQFVIDKTKPALTIQGVKHESANNQEEIGFTITAGDNNFGTMAPKLTALVRTEKGSFETVDIPMENEQTNGNDHIYNIPNLEEDGIYSLSCNVTDRAGNVCDKVVLQDESGSVYEEKTYAEADTLLEFSVNRLGSTYRLNLKPKDLNDSITNEKADNILVQIEEINVDELQENHTRLDLYNGIKADKIELKKGVNYQPGFAEGDGGWKKYTYTLDSENFKEDGNYRVGVYSMDKAGNESDSSLKNKAAAKIAFIIDRTKPKMSLNVENKTYYNEVEKTVELNITELHLDKKDIKVQVNGETLSMKKDMVDRGNGQFEFKLKDGMNQDIYVSCTDQAGNQEEVTVERITVSTNIMVRAGAWVLNNVLFAVVGAMTVLAVLGIIIWRINVTNKRKVEIDE